MRGLATILRRRTARVRVSANTERPRLAVLALLALILAVGTSVIFVGAASAAPLTFVDDGGADDEPGQKDLNFLTRRLRGSRGDQHRREVGLGRHGDVGQQHPRRGVPCSTRDARRVRELLALRHRRARPQQSSKRAVFVRRRSKRQVHEPAVTDPESCFDRERRRSVPNSDPFGVLTSPHFDPAHLVK